MKIPLHTAPWSHQIEGFRFAKDKPGCLLYWGMGSGKTLAAYMISTLSRGDTRTLVLCPKPVTHDWVEKATRDLAFPIQVVAPDRQGKARAKQIREALDSTGRVVVALSYQAALSAQVQPVLLGQRWNLVIGDESQSFKNPLGKTAILMSDLRDRADRRLCLSGTPFPHSLLDCFAQARFCDAGLYGTNWYHFRSRFAQLQDVPQNFLKGDARGKKAQRIVGIRNGAELTESLRSWVHRVATEDVVELPEARHLERPVFLESKALRAYKALEDEFEALVEDARGDARLIEANGALSKLLRLQQITGGCVGDENGRLQRISSAKHDALVEVFEEFPPSEPIVVFARFRSDLEDIHHAAHTAGRRSMELSGQRNEYPDWKSERDAPSILAVQIQAGGAGIDLTRAAVSIYYSLDWSLGNYEQSLARTHRPGQSCRVTYVHLVARGTVDERIYEAHRRKQDVVETVLARLVSNQENAA